MGLLSYNIDDYWAADTVSDCQCQSPVSVTCRIIGGGSPTNRFNATIL